MALYGIQKDITEKHNFENKIKEQLELLETLKNNMPVGMNFYDRNGILQDTNNYQRKLVGMKSDFKGIGKINALKLDFAVDSVIESLENSSTSSYIVTHKELSRELNEYLDDSQPHGEVFDVKCSPLFDGEESFKGYISIYNDITELYNSRKEILDLKNKLALALKAGDMEAWIYDTKKLIFTSIQGENLIDGDEISLDQLIEITHRDDVIILKECLYRLTNKISVLETAIFRINKENQWRWFKYNISKIDEENDTLRFAGIRKDVTEEIETKSQLEKSNLKLIESKDRKSVV